MVTATGALGDILSRTVNELLGGFREAIPLFVTGVVFLTLAYVGIRLVLAVLRRVLSRMYEGDKQLIGDLGVTVVGVFLWFGAALALLKIIGMGDVAASLGTATGFIALGVSYALSNMIADTVSGVYLLRDPDFNPGDTVTADGVTGEVLAIELRKSRFEVEGDTVVLANREVEKKWTKRE
jgi:small-conductance mechanosensitive channel